MAKFGQWRYNYNDYNRGSVFLKQLARKLAYRQDFTIL